MPVTFISDIFDTKVTYFDFSQPPVCVKKTRAQSFESWLYFRHHIKYKNTRTCITKFHDPSNHGSYRSVIIVVNCNHVMQLNWLAVEIFLTQIKLIDLLQTFRKTCSQHDAE
jgi:hypothetical protein